MRLVFKIWLLICFLSLSVFAKEINFAFLTDINLNPQNAYKLRNTVKELNSNKQIDFVVFGGNNIQKPNIDNLNYFTYLLKRVHKSAYVILGANDVSASSGIDKEYYMERVKKARFLFHSGKPNYVFKKGGYVFIVMDGSKQYFPQTNGCYTKQELAWFKKQLEKHKNDDVVILQHFPILKADSEHLQTAKLEDYYMVIKDYKNVKYIISGHYGVNLEKKTGHITHFLTEEYSKTGAYRIIRLNKSNDTGVSYVVK